MVVHTAAVFHRHTLVVTEDETGVTLTALHAHVFTAGGADYAQTCLGTRAHTQRVGAVRGAGQSCRGTERRERAQGGSDMELETDGSVVGK